MKFLNAAADTIKKTFVDTGRQRRPVLPEVGLREFCQHLGVKFSSETVWADPAVQLLSRLQPTHM